MNVLFFYTYKQRFIVKSEKYMLFSKKSLTFISKSGIINNVE